VEALTTYTAHLGLYFEIELTLGGCFAGQCEKFQFIAVGIPRKDNKAIDLDNVV
jgi:hypothetical protein